MLRGEFLGDSGSPSVACRVWIPRFDLRHVLPFCLDTGATYTMLMPGDALTMGIDYRLLGDEVDLATAGGRTSAFQEPTELVFEDRETSRAYSYLVLLTIAPLSTEISHLPSLLGRDIINRWRIDYHPTSSELRCEVITADEVVELLA